MTKNNIYCDDCDETPCQCALKVCGSAFSCCLLESEE